ncbi:hypothetical protein, partial [Streptomyces flaveolus]|uniref:hypothetical protein n=1 Tax=Streptomyces flaveolus TaxID=67297 RepID=UPI0033DCD2C0
GSNAFLRFDNFIKPTARESGQQDSRAWLHDPPDLTKGCPSSLGDQHAASDAVRGKAEGRLDVSGYSVNAGQVS